MKPGIIVVLMVGVLSMTAQPTANSILVEGSGDLGVIKLKAEQGDVDAQITLANAYFRRFKSADAFQWYKTAASKGSTEGSYRVGNMLLFGKVGLPASQEVVAKPLQGIRWTYSAATNGYQEAWRDMARIRRSAIGCATNLVEAYAWLGLLAEHGDVVARVDMNSLALNLSAAEIQQAKALIAKMKSGTWPPIPKAEIFRPHLVQLKSITISPNKKLAIINNYTVAEGDKVSVGVIDGRATLHCLEIQSNFVKIQIEGEEEPRSLNLSK